MRGDDVELSGNLCRCFVEFHFCPLCKKGAKILRAWTVRLYLATNGVELFLQAYQFFKAVFFLFVNLGDGVSFYG
jgi:hypothetical protein